MAIDETPAVGASRHNVFLSYAHADQAQATTLVAALESHGFEVWWDALIEGGALFADSIEAALKRCDAVVVLWSRQSVGSDWVRDEAAVGREQRKLVPLSLDGVDPPLGFGQYHAIDFSNWRGKAAAVEVQALLRAIAAASGAVSTPRSPLLSRAPDSRRQHSPEQHSRVSRRRLLQFSVASAVGVLAAAGGVYATRQGVFDSMLVAVGLAEADNSVAVLPFKNLSGDPQQAYFSSGIAQEVRATLARSNRFRVMAEMSSSAFGELHEGAVGIARKLGVAYLLEGNVRRSGNVVRIGADLIDGATGFSRWSQSFDRSLTDVFAVQTEIANAVTDAVLAEVQGASEQHGANTAGASELQVAPGGTTNVAAFDAYLRGRALYNQGGGEAMEREALKNLDAAIALDGNFAAAHAARSRSLTSYAFQHGSVHQRAALIEAAISAAQRAIAIAPALADGHSVLGFVLFQGRLDARRARAPFERSVKLGAGDASVLGRYALYSARAGRDRVALPAIRTALVLDPLNALIHGAHGTVHYAAGRYAQSIAAMNSALRLSPSAPYANALIGNCLLLLGRLADAQGAYAAEPAASVRLVGTAILAWKLGDKQRSRESMSELVRMFGDQELYLQARILAQRNELEGALRALESARRLADPGLVDALRDPFLNPLRRSPRFGVLLKSLGFD